MLLATSTLFVQSNLSTFIMSGKLLLPPFLSDITKNLEGLLYQVMHLHPESV